MRAAMTLLSEVSINVIYIYIYTWCIFAETTIILLFLSFCIYVRHYSIN